MFLFFNNTDCLSKVSIKFFVASMLLFIHGIDFIFANDKCFTVENDVLSSIF